jgi:hypothetical protein
MVPSIIHKQQCKTLLFEYIVSRNERLDHIIRLITRDIQQDGGKIHQLFVGRLMFNRELTTRQSKRGEQTMMIMMTITTATITNTLLSLSK